MIFVIIEIQKAVMSSGTGSLGKLYRAKPQCCIQKEDRCGNKKENVLPGPNYSIEEDVFREEQGTHLNLKKYLQMD